MKVLHIDGNSLSIEEFREVVYGRRPVLLASDAREAVERSRAVVDDILAQDKLA